MKHSPIAERNPVLLVVDDEPFNQFAISEFLEGSGCLLESAQSAEEAWDTLVDNPDKFDAVLLDRFMQGMDGLDLLRRIKRHDRLKLLPVILQTSASSAEQIAEGLYEGAFYYLAKPFKPEVIRAVVTTAVRDRSERLHMRESEQNWHTLTHLTQAQFSFRTPQEARHIADWLSRLCPSRQLAHLGLVELMLNAVEHGNLGLTYDEKTHFLAHSALPDEIERRLDLPEYKEKVASIHFSRADRCLRFTIQDQGQGFDWQPFLEMSMERIMDNHGRGIAMARSLAFSRLDYLGCGNCVAAEISLASAEPYPPA
ncbi:response regulator [Methylomonas sp. HYX-M1]|uniref:response regulator n=1 Tax=Methylomonas sp. HYX-M1 TaxID=3139307 RepID=UPI00345B9FDD